jgi:hypothetical protein
VYKGWKELDVDPDDHISFIVDSLKPAARDIGLTSSG